MKSKCLAITSAPYLRRPLSAPDRLSALSMDSAVQPEGETLRKRVSPLLVAFRTANQSVGAAGSLHFLRVGMMVAFFASAGVHSASAVNKYFDTSTATGLGGSATLSSQSSAFFNVNAAGTGALSAAAVGDDGIFSGTAGTVTLSASFGLASATFTVTGYTLAVTGGGTIIFTSPITLANNVNLNLTPLTTTALSLAGAVTGGTSSGFTVGGSTSTVNTALRINLSATGSDIAASAPITITTTGPGASGFVATSGTRIINASITNNAGAATLLGATATLTVNGQVSGTAGVLIGSGAGSGGGGAGTVNLNATNNYMGATTLNNSSGGVVNIGINDALPTGTTLQFGNTATLGNSTIDLKGFSQTIGQLTNLVGTGGTITNGGAAASVSKLTISGSDTTAAAFSGVIQNGLGTVSFERTGTGSTTLSGVNTFAGGTTVSGGTLVLGNATDTLANSGAVTVSGGVLSLGSNSDTVGAVTVSSGTISGAGTLTGSSYNLTNSGTISAALAGSGITLTKTGGGTATLSGANNTYSGTTTVSGGTLIVNGTNSGAGAVSVNGGTMGGSGTIAGAVTVGAAGTLAPTAMTTGALTLSSNSTLSIQLATGTASTGVNGYAFLKAPLLSLDGSALTLSLASGYTPNSGDIFFLINDPTSNAYNGGAFASVPNGYNVIYGADYSTGSLSGGNDVALTLAEVPEPSTVAVVFGLIGLVGWRERKRFKRKTPEIMDFLSA